MDSVNPGVDSDGERGNLMRIIRILKCMGCPYNAFSDNNEYDLICEKNGNGLARYMRFVDTPAHFDPITQTVTREKTSFELSADSGKTKWDGEIPEWCPLESI
jgi:hypothetical protein